jgi:tetratricopeptide (TPR) repeat protein
MRKISGLLLVPIFLAGWTAQRAANSQKPLVFAHVTVVDVTGGPLKPDLVIVITGDRITGMGDAKGFKLPIDADVVDATGKFLIPGLWDAHAHWGDRDYLPLFIANGITNVRIMYGQPYYHQWRKQIENGELLGPSMVIASPLLDGPVGMWPGSLTIHSAAEAREAVTRVKQAGADFVKVYSFLPRDAYFAIADESKKQGIPFVGHVPFSVSVEEASDAGQKSMEHMLGILPACSTREAELLKAAQDDLAEEIAAGKVNFIGPRSAKLGQLNLDTYSPEKAAALFARFKRNGTWQCPTLTLLRSLTFRSVPSFRDDARLKYMPRSVRASWQPESDPLVHNGAADDLELGKKQFQKELEIVGAMNRAGVGILAGTDVANAFCFPGFSLHDELALLVQSGLSPLAALQAATLNPARFLDKEKDLGVVDTSKLANLVLLDANPLDDIHNTTKIAGVVVAGKYFPKASLQGMLAKVQALASQKSIADALLKTIQEKDVGAAIQQYRELKSTQFAAYDFHEEELNDLGYQLIGMKRFAEAIEILKLNAEIFPASSNAYDSLAEAYMDHGDKDLAITNYRKSLELDATNTNAVEMLRKLNAQ